MGAEGDFAPILNKLILCRIRGNLDTAFLFLAKKTAPVVELNSYYISGGNFEGNTY